MKRFDFSLERVRQWREGQVTIEEAHLERIFSERSLIEQRLALLEREGRESAEVVKQPISVNAYELQAVDAFRRHLIAQRKVIAGLIEDCGRRIAEQQRKLLEARRKAELLNRLKDKRLKAWNVELAKEIEAEAGELFLAKWSNGRQ